MSDLTLSELEVDPSSYVDPNGFLFRHAGALFRAIRPAREPFYRGLLADGALGALAAAHHLVPAEVTEHRIPEIDCNLVLRHPSVSPVTYCVEWCPSMLRRAALTTLDLALAGLDRGALLQDAHPWNVLFAGTRPVFVDLTSLSPIETPLLWPAYQQFLNFFAHPLELGSLGKGRVARALLFDAIDGVRFEDLRAERPPSYPLRHPLRAAAEAVSARIERRLQKRPELKEKLQQASRSARFADPSGRLRRDFLRRLLRRTERIRVRAHPDSWRGYYAEVETDATSDLKAEQVQKLLEALRPASVLDLGCNVGRYATLAARAGAAVLAVDSSEHCVETLYRTAEAEGLAITPIVADVLNPTPAFGFLARQFPSLVTRARSDVVLCLGLMHHMHINGRQSFERIAELLAELARRAVIFEYIDLDDGNIRRLDHGRPIEYTLESVSRALGRHFRLTALDSDRPTRRLLLCEK